MTHSERDQPTTVFKNAIVRKPGRNFAEGLTSATLGLPDFRRVLEQHAAYCRALETCGLHVTVLPADLSHPDSTFVEDVAVLAKERAILTRPGAKSREGEVGAIREPLQKFFSEIHEITGPGTLDGGDICEAGKHFFIGISQRTNEEGARQLAEILGRDGYTSSFVDIRGMKGILHLKSGIAYLGDKNLVLWEEFAGFEQFHGYHHILVSGKERYAANCVRVNDYVMLPSGFPVLGAAIKKHGYNPLPLDVSEFEKMDGGLSCLSLRF